MALVINPLSTTCGNSGPGFRQSPAGSHVGYPDKIFKTNLVRTNAAVQDDKYCAPACCPDTAPFDQIGPGWDGVETAQAITNP